MTSPTEARLEILADPEALSRRVAEWMLELAKNKNGVFSVCPRAVRLHNNSMDIWPNRPIAMHSPGRERIGSGATSDSYRTMTR